MRPFRAIAPLLVFMLLASLAIRLTDELTSERIAKAQRRQALRQVTTAMPLPHDNDLVADVVMFRADGMPGFAHRAKLGAEVVGAVLVAETADGYNGPIRIAIGVNARRQILVVKILEHAETPGLGNGIHQDVSDWIQTFKGRALSDMAEADWDVRRDGGDFDALSGATVSPAAVIRTVHRSLQTLELDSERLFPPANTNLPARP